MYNMPVPCVRIYMTKEGPDMPRQNKRLYLKKNENEQSKGQQWFVLLIQN